MHRIFQSSPYALLMLAGIAVTAFLWQRRHRKRPEMTVVYVGALCGAFIGAKLAYLFAEAMGDWRQPDRWLRLATGKSIIGGLLGGYGGVEIVKRICGISRATGDAFALVCPLGLLMGRIGCCLHGCCQGIVLGGAGGTWRWPAPQVEGAFLLVLLLVFIQLQRHGVLRDRLFFLMLVCYGTFRFFHEWLRSTPKWAGNVSGYHILCLLMIWLGLRGLTRRTQAMRITDDQTRS